MKRILKRALSIFLVAVMVFGAAPLNGLVGLDLPELDGLGKLTNSISEFFRGFLPKAEAATYSGSCGENVTYTLDTNSGVLTISGTGAMTDYSYSSYVPWYYDSYFVKTVKIEKGITSICNFAFYFCSNLTSVTIPDSVTSIGKYSFGNCFSLKSIIIPDSVTSIGDYAFRECDSLVSVTIPDSVTSLAYYLFSNCDGLASITIGKGVTSIDDDAFYDCKGLTSITVDENNTAYSSDEYGVLFNKDKTTLIKYPAGNSRTAYKIPDSVVSIGSDAFRHSDSLVSVTIPDGLKSIGYYSFGNCDGLKSIIIPDSVTSIDDDAFCDCNGLASITVDENNTAYSSDKYGVLFNKDKTTLIQYPAGNSRTSYEIPDSVTKIGNDAFYNCDSLVSVAIPDSVTGIEGFAFYDCDSLKSITIPDNVTSTGYYLFAYCDSLESAEIGSGVAYMGNYAFLDCAKLASVTLSYGVTNIGESVFENCDSLVSIKIPDSVTKIGYGVFYDCDGLKSIKIPDSVTRMANKVFHSCDSLETVTIGNGVTCIDSGTFYDCVSLENIRIGNSVTSISTQAFDGCVSLKSITLPNSVIKIGSSAFSDCISLESITIPASVTSIGVIVFYGCSSLASITVDKNNTVYSSENGVVFNKDKTTLILYPEGKKEACYEIPNGVTSIGDDSFYNCDNLNMVVIPDGVMSIGNSAFYDCNNLNNIAIPDSVASIVSNAFYDCNISVVYYGGTAEQWNEINIQSGNWRLSNAGMVYNFVALADDGACKYIVTKDGATLAKCYSQDESVIISSKVEGYDVTSISEYAFENCTGLKNLTVPSTVTQIGSYAFDGCNGLEKIYYDSTLAQWSKISVDYGNYPLDDAVIYASDNTGSCGEDLLWVYNSNGNLVIEGSGEMSDWDSFADIPWNIYSDNISSVRLPYGITSVGENAFGGIAGLTDVYFDGSYSEWSSVTIYDGNDNLSAATIHFSSTSATDTIIASGVCGDSVYWTIDNTGKLVIGGTGEMYNYNLFEGSVAPPYLFDYYEYITEVVINQGVTRISDTAFVECENLKTVAIPQSVENVGFLSFAMCGSIENISVDENNKNYSSVNGVLFDKNKTVLYQYAGSSASYTVPDTVTEIAPYAFALHDEMKAIILPESLVTISEYAFGACENLADIIIPDNVTSIREGAFVSCYNLQSIHIGKSVSSIGADAFGDCDELITITVDKKNDYYIVEDGSVLFDADQKELVKYAPGRKDNEYTIPNSVITIAPNAFDDCQYLISIYLGKNVETIGSEAFAYCNNLMRINITESVTIIEEDAFINCYNLSSVYYHGSEEEWGTVSISDGNGYLLQATIYFDSTDKSKNVIDSDTCGENVTWTLYDNGELVISGTGAMAEWSGSYYVPWNSYTNSIYKITFEGEITSIGSYAFYGCERISEVAIPETVTFVGRYAFAYCDNLADVEIPEGVVSIGEYAFYSCESLESIHIPSSVTEIGDRAFNIYSTASEITFDDGVNIVFGRGISTKLNIGKDASDFDFISTVCNDVAQQISEITLDSENESFRLIDGVLYDNEVKTILIYPTASTADTYVMPETVEELSDLMVNNMNFAFGYARSIKNITIGKNFKVYQDILYDYEETYFSKAEEYNEWYAEALVGSYLSEMTIMALLPLSIKNITVDEENEWFYVEDGSLYANIADKKILLVYNKNSDNNFYEITTDCVVTPMSFLFSNGLTINISDSYIEYTAKGMESYIEKGGTSSSFTSVENFYSEFFMATSAAAFTVSTENDYLCTLDGVLYNKDMTTLIRYPVDSKMEFYYIPETVVKIMSGGMSPFFSLTVSEEGIPEYCHPENLTVHINDINTDGFSYEGLCFVCSSIITESEANQINQNLKEEYEEFFSELLEFKNEYESEESGSSYLEYIVSINLYSSIYDVCASVSSCDGDHPTHTHTLISDVVKQPTCSEYGEIKNDCECGYRYYSKIEKTEHTLSTITIEATCTKNGETYDECIVCNGIFNITVIPASHKTEHVVIESTCTEYGEEYDYCSSCEQTLNKVTLPLAEHDLTHYVVESTCDKYGEEYDICSGCEQTLNKVILPLAEHDLTHHVVDSTCTVQGSEYDTCSVCQKTLNKVLLPYEEHDLTHHVVESTCTVQGSEYDTCSVCKQELNKVYYPLKEHELTHYSVESTCTVQGSEYDICSSCNQALNKVMLPLIDHEYTHKSAESTCTVQGYEEDYCSKCKKTYNHIVLPLKEHELEHVKVDSTCLAEGYEYDICSVCKNKFDYTKISMKEHELEHVKVDSTCTAEGYEYDICSVCKNKFDYKEIPMKEHTLEHIKVDSTCTVEGYEYDLCSVCKNEFDRIIIPMKPHELEHTKVDSTCTVEGYEYDTCLVCKNELNRVIIPLKAHELEHFVIDSTCTKEGVEYDKCSVCETELNQVVVPLKEHTLEHVRVSSTCTVQGYEYDICSACETKFNYTDLPLKEHEYAETVVHPTCTEEGYTLFECENCQYNYKDYYTDVLGHDLSDWQETITPTCTKDGEEQRYCSRCEYKEKQTLKAEGHKWSDWSISKEATVLSEGLSVRSCSACNESEKQVIDKVHVDIETNENYGLANFTVVNAQTKEPIEGASIFISTEKDGENTFSTDVDGKISIVLPVGKQTISVYADGCLTRNLKITVKSGENDIPVIGLSDKETYEVELTSEEMTYDEIVEAGIDTSAPGNNHVFEYELKLEFEPEIDWASLMFYMNGNGVIIGPKLPSGGGSSGDGNPGRSWTWIPPDDDDKGHFVIEPKEENEEEIIVYPVSEYMYLIIRGEITWLKEMFDVEMLVINNSMTDTLENLTCTLELPEGLSLATMVGEQQSLIQTIDHIAEGESDSVHWYVRGDAAGTYDLKAKLEGTIMPFEEVINEEFVTKNAIHVWAGEAMNLHFEFPDAAYHGVDYPVRITLTNVSDKSLYNVCHSIKNIKQSRITHYSDGKVVNEAYMDENFIGRKFVKEFKPGDKIVMEVSINILFESELMEYELQKLVGFVDGIEKILEAYKAVKTALDIMSALDNCISSCEKALDNFLKTTTSLSEAKLTLARDLYKSISKLMRKYSSSGNKAIDSAAKIGDSTLILTLDALASDPETFLEELAYDDIKALIKDVEAFGNLVDQGDAELKKFDIFDSIRTAIESLPIVFALKNVIFTESASNTTSIPWSYSTTDAGPQYFGVSNVGAYYGNLMKAIMAEVWDESIPSYLKLIPGVDDPFKYDEVKREIIAVEKEIAEFKAKDATGKITFNAWIESKEKDSGLMTYALNFFRGDDFELSCDNDTAAVENGVLTFTGDGTISVVPQNTDGGILIIEDSEGNRYEYDITVVEQHECSADEHEVILNPTSRYDGFAVKRCGICEDILDIEILYADGCETHSFGEWVTDCEATCSAKGIISRVCSICGYCEVDYSESAAHTPGEWTKVEATETESEKQIRVCTVCGEVTDEKYVDYIPVESVSLDFTSMDILNTQKGKLAVSVLPEKASNRSVAWYSGDKNIVTVSNDGTVTAVAPGTAEITVTTEDGDFSATCVVTVLPRTFNVTWDSGENKTVNGEKEGTIITVPEEPVKDGYTFTGWTPEVPELMPAEDLAFTATWNANSYDAVFDANGGKWDDGTETKTVSTDFDAEIKAPAVPEKQGYIFSKWSPEVGVMDSVDGKKFVAEWIPATDTRYTVETYIMNTSGDYEKVDQTLAGTTDSTVSAEYTVESGFALNSEESVLSGTVAADNSLVLKVYIDRNTYTFTTVVDGVSTETKYLYGSMISEPVTPSKTDYKFIEWDGTIPETMPAENVTITAVFEKCYLCPECGNEILGEDVIKDHIAFETKVTISDGVGVTSGELKPYATITVSAPQVDGKIFSHWTVDGATVEDEESAETKIVIGSGKITITAEYEDCDCKCHKDGIVGFFFKIVLFFQKLFGKNLECFCGKKH